MRVLDIKLKGGRYPHTLSSPLIMSVHDKVGSVQKDARKPYSSAESTASHAIKNVDTESDDSSKLPSTIGDPANLTDDAVVGMSETEDRPVERKILNPPLYVNKDDDEMGFDAVSPKISPEISHDSDVDISDIAVDLQATLLGPQSNVRTPVVDPELFDAFPIDSSVSAPRKDADLAGKPFISYQITTTTKHPSVLRLCKGYVEEKPIKVRRRYHDFVCLHECLSNDYPATMIPPLPSKLNFKYLTGDTLSNAFVTKRLHSLDRFVFFVVGHRDLLQLLIFHLFVSDSLDWVNFTKSLKTKDMDESGHAHGSGFVAKVVNEELISETVMNFLTPAKYKRETNLDILQINDKLKKLYENLLKLDRIFVKLNKKHHDMAADYQSFAQQISKISHVQAGDDKSENTVSASNFDVFADCLLFLLQSWSLLGEHIDESFLVALKDCSKYIASLTALIDLQHLKNVDLQVLRDYLLKAQHGLDAVNSTGHPGPNLSPPGARSHLSLGIVTKSTQLIKDTLSTSATPHVGSAATEIKARKLEVKISQLQEEIAAQTSVVDELTSKLINEEYPYWKQFNQETLKRAMLGLCDQQIGFFSGLVDNWSVAEKKLMERLQDLE